MAWYRRPFWPAGKAHLASIPRFGEREAVGSGRRLQPARWTAYGHLAVSSARPGSLSLSRFRLMHTIQGLSRRGRACLQVGGSIGLVQ